MIDYSIVSIAAYDRSGTTFLGGLLNGYRNTFYMGELDQGFKILSHQHETLCTCGSKVKECPVWEPVPKFLEKPKERNKTEMIYTYLARETKSSIIIDSSKKVDQIRCASAHSKGNQVLIHLIRNPKGVIYSRMKTTKRLLSKGIHPRPGIAKHTNLLLITDTLNWCYRNIQLERYKKKRESVTVIYEDLETDFDKRIFPFLNEKVGLTSDQDKNSVPHILGGNINRYNGIGDIRIDYSWKEGLNSFQKSIVDLITFPVRKFYGYNF